MGHVIASKQIFNAINIPFNVNKRSTEIYSGKSLIVSIVDGLDIPNVALRGNSICVIDPTNYP